MSNVPGVPKSGNGVFEIVLGSGRFVSLRRLTVSDIIFAAAVFDQQPPERRANIMFNFLVLQRVMEIDGKRLSMAQVMEEDFEDLAPALNEVNRRISVSVAARGGVA